MSFKIDLVQQSLQPVASVARLAREHGINDNLLFTWRQRYRQLPLLPAPPPAAVPSLPSRYEQTCEIVIGPARLKLSGHLTPAMLATLVRELKRGRR